MRDDLHLPNGLDPVLFRAVVGGERVPATLDRNAAGTLIVRIAPPFREESYTVAGDVDDADLPITGAIVTAPRALRFASDAELAQRAADRERAQREAAAQREREQIARAAAAAERERAAKEFNDALALPFRWYPAIKIVLTGLYESRGDGRNRRTTPHIALEEAFARGRLKRKQGQLLCGGWPGGQGFDRRAWEATGERVRCAACLAIAARLKSTAAAPAGTPAGDVELTQPREIIEPDQPDP